MQQRACSEAGFTTISSSPFARSIPSSSVVPRRCSWENGWERSRSSGSRRSLEGHETPDAFVLTPHTAPSYSDRKICPLGLRLADQQLARLREASLWLALPGDKRARFPLICCCPNHAGWL